MPKESHTLGSSFDAMMDQLLSMQMADLEKRNFVVRDEFGRYRLTRKGWSVLIACADPTLSKPKRGQRV
jgi:DNA-binding HxlR family transcriptional regulator